MNPIKLSAAFKGLGLNDDFPQSKTKDIVCNGLSHDKETTHNNVEYEVISYALALSDFRDHMLTPNNRIQRLISPQS